MIDKSPLVLHWEKRGRVTEFADTPRNVEKPGRWLIRSAGKPGVRSLFLNGKFISTGTTDELKQRAWELTVWKPDASYVAIGPNWIKQMPASEFKSMFEIDFKGPGLYLTATDTLLVVPLPPGGNSSYTIWLPWNEQPAGSLIQVHVFNAPFEQTIWAAMSVDAVLMDASETRPPIWDLR